MRLITTFTKPTMVNPTPANDMSAAIGLGSNESDSGADITEASK